MEVRKMIDDLRAALDRITSEEELLQVITNRLTALRRSFPSQKMGFTPDDVAFLQSLTPISAHLRAFIDLKGEALTVRSLEEYTDVVSHLTRIRQSLADLPVARRVGKEIRELNERLPAIRESDESNREFRTAARISTLEQNPRRCRRGHEMVIRKGEHGYFWGCTRFPFCAEHAQLTRDERDLLDS